MDGNGGVSVVERGYLLETFIELHGHRLTTNRQNLQGVFVHAQLGIGNLHTPDQFLDLIRQCVQVVAATFKGKHRGGIGILVGHG